jgi:S-adenosylmethionine synthetase
LWGSTSFVVAFHPMAKSQKIPFSTEVFLAQQGLVGQHPMLGTSTTMFFSFFFYVPLGSLHH